MPTIVTTGVPASRSTLSCGSRSAAPPARRVEHRVLGLQFGRDRLLALVRQHKGGDPLRLESPQDALAVLGSLPLVEVGHNFSHGGRALANRTIDAHHILSALVEDGVDGDGSLAGLAIAEN